MIRSAMVLAVGLGVVLSGRGEAFSITESNDDFYISVSGNTNGEPPSGPIVLSNPGQSTSGITTITLSYDLSFTGGTPITNAMLYLDFTDLDVSGQFGLPGYFLQESVSVKIGGNTVWDSSLLSNPNPFNSNFMNVPVDLSLLNGQSLTSLDVVLEFVGELSYYGLPGNQVGFLNTPESVSGTFSAEPIPEPTTIALFGAGALALASRRKKIRN